MGLADIRQKIAFYLEDSRTQPGKLIDLALLAVNIWACALFVIGSYCGEVPTWYRIADAITVSIFIIEYVARIVSAPNKLAYVFSAYGLIDLLSIIPSLVSPGRLAFLRALKVLRILRFLRFLETAEFFFGSISRLQLQVWRTLFTVFTILFVSAGFVLAAESSSAQAQITTFGEAFYFTVSTLSTVGFGDLVAVTPRGRAVVVVMILAGAVLIPWQAGKLVAHLVRYDPRRKPVTCPECGYTGHDDDASHCKACGAVIYQEYEGN